MRRPHPLLVLLLLLASLPAVIGGSLTHLCACEGLIYVTGCSCVKPSTAPATGCTCGAHHRHIHPNPGATHAPQPADAPAPSETPGQETPHDCDYMAYQLGVNLVQAQLPPCPTAILHRSLMPPSVWDTSLHPPVADAKLTGIPLPCKRQRPLLI